MDALSQGEIGKRAFTQALAKRMMAKATGMQRDYEVSAEAASLAASSSGAVESTAGDLRCVRLVVAGVVVAVGLEVVAGVVVVVVVRNGWGL